MMTRLGKEKRVRNNTMNKMNKMDNMNHMNHMDLGWEGKRKQGSKQHIAGWLGWAGPLVLQYCM